MRLLTRSDFDGLACAVLLKDVGLISRYRFVHPNDLQNGKIEVGEKDVLANVPYLPGCGLWFDHHATEHDRMQSQNFEFEGAIAPYPSTARVIWDYYGGAETFDRHFEPMMEAVDKVNSGNLTAGDIVAPSPWVMLGYLMDPRTGLGRYPFRLNHGALFEEMVEQCRNRTVEEIYALNDIKEREALYDDHAYLFRTMLENRARLEENVLVLDLREQDPIYCGNRFLLYTLFPQASVSLQVMWGFQRQNIVISCGESVLNRSNEVNIGALMAQFGGGGHKQVGGCQVPIERADEVLETLVAELKSGSLVGV